jgi:hypothetical protein
LGIKFSPQLINAEVRLLTDAGGDFYYPNSSQPKFRNEWKADFILEGSLKTKFQDNIVESAWELLSADFSKLDTDAAAKCVAILTEMAAGRHHGLQLLWKKARCNNEDIVLHSVLHELLSLSSSIDSIHPFQQALRALFRVFLICNRTGCIDNANAALSLLFGMCEGFAIHMATGLSSWDFYSCSIVYHGSEETFAILECTSLLKPNVVIYWKILSPWAACKL